MPENMRTTPYVSMNAGPSIGKLALLAMAFRKNRYDRRKSVARIADTEETGRFDSM